MRGFQSYLEVGNKLADCGEVLEQSAYYP